MRPNIVEGARDLLRRQCIWLVGPDHFAAEAKPAIDRAHMGQFEQNTIRIAVNDPLNGAVRIVADRISEFFRAMIEFCGVRHELPCDRIGRIVTIDQFGQCRRQRDRVVRGNGLERDPLVGRYQPPVT